MTGERSGGSPSLRCLGRVASTAAVALAGLLLARGEPLSGTVTVLVVGVWLWLAISVTVGIVRLAIAGMSEAASKENTNPWNVMLRVPRPCAWTGLLLVAVATAALFAAGKSTLATTMEVFLLWRLALAIAGDRPCEPDRNAPAASVDYMPLTSGPGMFGICVTAGALWLALGAPPGWAEEMILTYFWILVVGVIAAGTIAAYGWTVGRTGLQKHYDSRRRSGEWSDRPPPRLTPPVTPEPPRSTGQQLTMWLWRARWIAIAWALWAASQPLLAGLYLLASLIMLAARTRARCEKHGDSARIDVLARVVYVIVWWPLVAVATSVVTAFVVPFIIVDNIWRWLSGGRDKSKLELQTSWEREARLERAHVHRAAASYRLREVFGKPDGFVYFMSSEPHQRQHFLGPGGLLANLGDSVVARDYRTHVLTARTTRNWKAFNRSPEGALLHVNGISNMRRDLPFIAVVPPRGLVQVFRLSEPYRARMREGGAALAQAETEVRVAIATQLGIGGEFAELIRN